MEHHPLVSVSLTVKDAAQALAFYQEAIGAVETYRLEIPGQGVVHAEFEVAGTKLFISGEAPDWGAQAMPEEVTASCLFTIIVEDCDAWYAKAISAGATSVSEPQD